MYDTFSHQTQWQGSLDPQGGSLQRRGGGGTGKAREDQLSSSPAAASPGPAAQGADSSPKAFGGEEP